MGLINKIKYRNKLAKYFKLIEVFLLNGYYIVKNKNIVKISASEAPFYKRFKVKSKNPKLFNYDSGTLFFTKYKSGLLTNDKAFYFIKNFERYNSYKNNYFKYKNELSYPSFSLDFDDKRMMVVGPIIKGTIYKDLSHFDIFLDYLFKYAGNSSYVFKESNIGGIKLPWYVQHGDCKNANIVWHDDNSFTMIDLEAIDLFPPLYDVFYYLFISKKEDSIKVLNSETFNNKVCAFFSKILGDVPKNIVDICLSNYAYFTASNLKKDSELYEFEFYLFWRQYDTFINFPLTKDVLDKYAERLISYGIK